jgi:replicative DNA helicase
MDTDPLHNKGLPAAVDAEKAILGAVLLNNDLIKQVEKLLEVGDFHLDSHRRILEAMLNLSKQDMPIDLVTLIADLQARNIFEQVGGATYIASLIDGVPRTDTIVYHARIVRRKSAERETVQLLNLELTRLVDGEDNLESIIQSITSKLDGITKRANLKRKISGVYPSLNDLLSAKLEEPEQILFGLHRGEVAGLLAVTNYGKSTLLLNTSISVAAGEMCWPLAPLVPAPRRVFYIDSESPAARLRTDLQTMLHQIKNPQTARDNIMVAVDAFGNEPLNLVKPDHFNLIVLLAKKHKADLVIIDTAASAFELQDENSNAEVTRRVMNPLKRLAREVNCAVIFTHHIGKANETQSGEAAYRGRGASAFGALSRTVFTIERDNKKGAGYIVLNCAKLKGEPFEPVLLWLNPQTRWFEICDEEPSPRPVPPTAQEIAEFVKEQSEARTSDICNHFKTRAGSRTVEDRIKEAERLGLIYKANQKAPWRFRNGKKEDSGDSEESPTESADNPFPHFRNTIWDCGNAETATDERREPDLTYCPSCGAAGLIHSHCDRCGEFLR